MTPPDNLSSVAGPSRLPALDIFPGLPRMSAIAEPRSDFDYQVAMRSDILDATLLWIVQSPRDRVELDSENHPMYFVDSDDEILASDPYIPYSVVNIPLTSTFLPILPIVYTTLFPILPNINLSSGLILSLFAHEMC
jgi:hypothetical protein